MGTTAPAPAPPSPTSTAITAPVPPQYGHHRPNTAPVRPSPPQYQHHCAGTSITVPVPAPAPWFTPAPTSQPQDWHPHPVPALVPAPLPWYQHAHPMLVLVLPVPASPIPLGATPTSTTCGPPLRLTMATQYRYSSTIAGSSSCPLGQKGRGQKQLKNTPDPSILVSEAGRGSTHVSASQGHRCRPHPFPSDTKITSPKKYHCWDGKLWAGGTIIGMGNHCGDGISSWGWEIILGMGYHRGDGKSSWGWDIITSITITAPVAA